MYNFEILVRFAVISLSICAILATTDPGPNLPIRQRIDRADGKPDKPEGSYTLECPSEKPGCESEDCLGDTLADVRTRCIKLSLQSQ